MSCQHVWERRDKQPWCLPYYICTECEMELSASQYEAIQQAHRAAEESAKDAHRRGWEQAKMEAIKEIQSNPIMYPVTVGGGIAGQYVVDTVAVNAIARMEYKKEAKDE